MSTQSYKNKDAYSSLGSIPDKMAVFQECLQQTSASPINAKKSRQLLAKLLRLIYNGEVFPPLESTALFFAISKLFQHKDASLRQLVYLTIKELSKTSDDIMMLTASIMKDIQGKDAIYKPNAIRTLSKVLDSATVSSSERLIKNAIVDKNPIISSAALITSYNLLPIAKDVVKSYANAASDTISSNKQFPSDQFQLHEYYGSSTQNLPSTSYMYQYHALGLLHPLKNQDKIGLMKFISNLASSSNLKNSLSIIQLIRYMNKIIIDDESLFQHLYPFLSSFLKHKSDMVELEASKTLISFNNLLKDDQFMTIVNTLQKLLSVPRIATRFAAVRLINKISIKNPEKIVVVNLELENLINDSNRSISTLAITTLLKTMSSSADQGTGGANVDRLITKMTSLMDEITEDFKIVIIDAIENLTLKFPSKHKKLVSFLTDLLRDDGSLLLKTSIVDALFDLIKYLDDSSAKQLILMNLCEYIEDCEFAELSVRILHLLGEEGPYTSNPSYYIRHIYNRLVLENSIVRSSAVISLAKFASICGGDVANNIKILLSRCLNDVDDEVRDRAAISLQLISSGQKHLVVLESRYDLASLEHKLTLYLNSETFEKQFDISEVKLYSNEEYKSLQYNKKVNQIENTTSDGEAASETTQKETGSENLNTSNDLLKQQAFEQELSEIELFKDYGKLSKSTITPFYLTDKENEFVVTANKHFFIDTQKLVIQYTITNTLPRSKLVNISVVAQPDNDLYTEEVTTELPELGPDQTGTVYVSFSTPSVEDELISAFGNTITFNNKDIIDDEGNVDESDEGYYEEYAIEDLEILSGDFTTPLYNSNFTSVFDQLPNYESAVKTIQKVDSLESAVSKLKSSLSLMALDGSDYVPSDTASHNLKLLGKDVWGGKVAVSIKLALTGGKVVAKLEAKAETENFSSFVLTSAE